MLHIYRVEKMIAASMVIKNRPCSVRFTQSGTISMWFTVHAVVPSKRMAQGETARKPSKKWLQGIPKGFFDVHPQDIEEYQKASHLQLDVFRGFFLSAVYNVRSSASSSEMEAIW